MSNDAVLVELNNTVIVIDPRIEYLHSLSSVIAGGLDSWRIESSDRMCCIRVPVRTEFDDSVVDCHIYVAATIDCNTGLAV